MISNEESTKIEIFNQSKLKAKIMLSIFRVPKAVFLFNKLSYHINFNSSFILILGHTTKDTDKFSGLQFQRNIAQ